MLQESFLLLRSNGKNPRLLVADEEKKKELIARNTHSC